MKLPIFLLACATLVPEPSSGVIKDSTSPDKKFDVVAVSKDDGIHYHVEAKDGSWASEDFKSDFGSKRLLDTALSNTLIHWRSDSLYLVLDAGHDRIHEDSLILKKGPTGFVALAFDWEKSMDSAHIKSLGFGYPAFNHWLPNNRIQIHLTNYDGRNAFQPINLILDMDRSLSVVSYEVLPEKDK